MMRLVLLVFEIFCDDFLVNFAAFLPNYRSDYSVIGLFCSTWAFFLVDNKMDTDFAHFA